MSCGMRAVTAWMPPEDLVVGKANPPHRDRTEGALWPPLLWFLPLQPQVSVELLHCQWQLLACPPMTPPGAALKGSWGNMGVSGGGFL